MLRAVEAELVHPSLPMPARRPAPRVSSRPATEPVSLMPPRPAILLVPRFLPGLGMELACPMRARTATARVSQVLPEPVFWVRPELG